MNENLAGLDLYAEDEGLEGLWAEELPAAGSPSSTLGTASTQSTLACPFSTAGSAATAGSAG